MCKQSKVTTVIKQQNNDCRLLLTNFHLLLFGVTTTIITKVGEVVAFSVSLVSAVRAKLDSCYLQRQISVFLSTPEFHQQQYPWPNRFRLAPIVISRRRTFSCQRRDQ
jgi:hypothetical protein